MPDRVLGPPHIPTLSAPVDIAFDQDGIPRIRAGNDRDAAAALGWVHARDRAFQMDLMRRAVSGRLSEIAGPATLRTDRMMRILGLRARAIADWQTMPQGTRELLQAYADGVNAWFAARGRFSAPEFILLGDPEPWTPIDSLLWGKLMGLWLSNNWTAEAARLGLEDTLSPAQILALWPDSPAASPSARTLWPDYADAARRLLAATPRFPDPFTLPPTASDAWAVDAAHSSTGAPLLAGDPHLGLGFPSLWYLARIDTPDTTEAGAFAPGVPFLVIGRNRHIAWTFTTTGADTQDLFVETMLPDGRYLTPDGPTSFAAHEEVIKVRGQPDQPVIIRASRHGPIVSDINPQPGKPVLALQAMALAEGDTAAAGLVALDRAASVAEAAAAAPLITAPVQNLMVADHDHIALLMTGRVPVRKAGDGRLPVPGADGAHDWIGADGAHDWSAADGAHDRSAADGAHDRSAADGAHDWIGSATGARLPATLDPPSGHLVNANEPVVGHDFPVMISEDWYSDWRAKRIRALLAARPKHTVADFTAMQADTVSAFAAAMLPHLRGLTVPADQPLAAGALGLLQNWDGDLRDDRPEPLIFNAWLQRFYLDSLAAVVGADQTSAAEPAAPWLEVTANLIEPGCTADCATRLITALETSTAELARRFGPTPETWRWGAAHVAVFAHPILGPIGATTIEVPGDDTTLFRSGGTPGDLTARHGAEFRGVYDLADLDRSQFVLIPGQSGNLLSSHAHDFLARWRIGATVPLDPYPGNVVLRVRVEP
jgi:penicillin amidase